jgi:hypothetical protein
MRPDTVADGRPATPPSDPSTPGLEHQGGLPHLQGGQTIDVIVPSYIRSLPLSRRKEIGPGRQTSAPSRLPIRSAASAPRGAGIGFTSGVPNPNPLLSTSFSPMCRGSRDVIFALLGRYGSQEPEHAGGDQCLHWIVSTAPSQGSVSPAMPGRGCGSTASFQSTNSGQPLTGSNGLSGSVPRQRSSSGLNSPVSSSVDEQLSQSPRLAMRSRLNRGAGAPFTGAAAPTWRPGCGWPPGPFSELL